MKNKHPKGTHVCLSENGELKAWSTNLSHDVEIENGDIFTINWGKGDINYKTIDSKYPIVAEEIEEGDDRFEPMSNEQLVMELSVAISNVYEFRTPDNHADSSLLVYRDDVRKEILRRLEAK